MQFLKEALVVVILTILLFIAFYIQDKSFAYEAPQLIDHVHHLQTLVDIDPSFKERVRNCGDYTQRRPYFDTVEIEGKDTNFGYGLLCNDGSFIGAFIVDSKFPTYYHYSKEETLLLPSMS